MVVFKEREPYDILEEMAGLRKSDSGLPVNLWLDNMSSYTRAGHWKRIKVQGDYGNKVNPKNMFSMTISEDPQILPPDAIHKIKLPAKDIEKVRQFVINNHKLLSKLADQEISFLQFGKMMKI